MAKTDTIPPKKKCRKGVCQQPCWGRGRSVGACTPCRPVGACSGMTTRSVHCYITTWLHLSPHVMNRQARNTRQEATSNTQQQATRRLVLAPAPAQANSVFRFAQWCPLQTSVFGPKTCAGRPQNPRRLGVPPGAGPKAGETRHDQSKPPQPLPHHLHRWPQRGPFHGPDGERDHCGTQKSHTGLTGLLPPEAALEAACGSCWGRTASNTTNWPHLRPHSRYCDAKGTCLGQPPPPPP